MSINRLPEITFVFIVCLVDFVWKYCFGGERFPTEAWHSTLDPNSGNDHILLVEVYNGIARA